DRPAAAVAHHADAAHVHVATLRQVVDAAIDVIHTLARQRSAQQQRVHGSVMAAVLADVGLVLLAAQAKRTLLDAQGGNAALHAAEREIAIARHFHWLALIITLDADAVMHARGVALQ